MLAVALFWACSAPDPPPESDPAGLTVSVATFKVAGQLEGAEIVGRAFAQSIVADLSQVRNLEVAVADVGSIPARTTHAVSGSIVRSATATRLSLELRDAATDRVVWESGERDGADLSNAASDLGREIAGAIGLTYPTLYPYIDDFPAGERMAASPLIARAAEARARRAFTESADICLEIVEEFGDDPASHVLHAWSLMLAWDANPDEDTLAKLRERLTELDRVDPSSPYDDLIRAYVYRSSGEPGQARVVYSWVLDGAGLSGTARAWALRQRALAGLQVGDAESARRDAQEAASLDPTRSQNLVALSKALEALGQLDEAAEAARTALALGPHWRHQQRLGLVYSRAGRFDEATQSLRAACEQGKNQEVCANLAVSLGRAGEEEAAREAAEYAGTLPETPWGTYNLACYRARVGDGPGAVRELNRALELGFADTLIATDPDLDSIRGLKAFKDVALAIEDRLTTRRRQSSSIFPWQS